MDGKLRNMTTVFLSRGSKMLLLYRQGSRVVNDLWIGSAGGHFEENELNNARGCVLRELKEELNIVESQIENLSLRYITLRRAKGEIRQNYYFFADLKDDTDHVITANEGILKWFDYTEISLLDMPFSAKHVINHYVKIGMYNDYLYGGIADGEKVVFVNLPEF